MTRLSRVQLILLAAGGSLALIAGALLFQAMGYAPCKLCLWQRWPHGVAIALGVAAFLPRIAVLPWAGAAAAAATAGLGVYHTGVERGWWPGPDTCTSGGDIGSLSAADLLAQINQAPLIRCDEVAWQFLTLSMASWNAILSLGLVAIWIAAARRA